jgi:multicomponent K+:H+ antiporter subunit D
MNAPLIAPMAWPHWIIVPVVLPLLAGGLLLLVEKRRPNLAWALSLASTLALVAVGAYLLLQAAGGSIHSYLLGNWRAPFGIALALDRLSALMLLLTAVIGLVALLYARAGTAQRGQHFHALLQFQLMGLAGAFLTADLFNLFVFFEVLLIASYGLLLHGLGTERLRASVHYVTFNLAGSALFLLAVALLYGVTGTLNLADLAQRVSAAAPADVALIQSAGLMLLVVFCVKAALLPLYFWLPDTYAAATAPVAALFAIMTKVGVYAIARVHTLVFGADAGPLAHLAQPWLAWLAMGTLLLAALGALSAKRLRTLVAYLVVASAGTLLLALGLGTRGTIAAGLFYLVPSTLVAATLFLLVDRIKRSRGAGDAMDGSAWSASPIALGVVFFVCAVSAAGMPPLAGFLGKALLLQAAATAAYPAASWTVILVSSLVIVFTLARAGSSLFWKASVAPAPAAPVTPAAASERAALAILLTALVGAAAAAGPLSRYTEAAASQLTERRGYVEAVLGAQPVPPAWNVREGMVKP